jgi:hypothetical protein
MTPLSAWQTLAHEGFCGKHEFPDWRAVPLCLGSIGPPAEAEADFSATLVQPALAE